MLAGTCPASIALQNGAKGHNVKGNYLTGKPRPLRAGSFTNLRSPFVFQQQTKSPHCFSFPKSFGKLAKTEIIWERND